MTDIEQAKEDAREMSDSLNKMYHDRVKEFRLKHAGLDISPAIELLSIYDTGKPIPYFTCKTVVRNDD